MKKITQIIAYYNEEKYIAKCIQSLLNQSYENLEIIAVNDGSTDRGPEIVASFADPRIIMINNETNHGQGYCRNQGLDIATGEYIGFFDGDDISFKDRVSILAAFLDEHENIFCVSCDYEYIDENDALIPREKHSIVTGSDNIRAELLFGCPVGCSCALFRKSLIDKYNLRELEGCKTAEDYHFWLQCLQYGNFENIDKPLFYYRQHNSQSKIAERRNVTKHDEWMKKVFEFGWISRGFNATNYDIDFIYYKLYRNQQIWTPTQLVELKNLYKKVKDEARQLGLPEAELILRGIKKRAYILIPYLYPIRLFNRIIKKD